MINPFWKNKSVLVTGAGGFIGSHLVERLHVEGARVRAFVRYNSRGDIGLLNELPDEARKDIEIIGGDIRDSSAILKAAENIEVVFHLGALISIPYSYLRPREVAESNFIGTLNVLLACQQHKVARMIHTSTSEVYGTARYAPIDEAHPLQGQSPYSASKIGADKLAESFYCAYNAPVVTVRPFNTYGPRQSARAIIPTIITQVLGSNTLKLGNLEAARDFTFVDDTVDGFIKAAQTAGVEGQTFNLGTGSEIRVGELAGKIMQLAGRQVEIQKEALRMRPDKSEVMRLISDNSLARKSLDWTPHVSLDEGLGRVIEWLRPRLGRYKVGKYEF
ncbi:MAG: SDR family NAD(P)-dependent oxidoreductase [Anaerolineales bacterium]|nr:SDR family NAD(P)-dependent oxidoreductase [Anaerolineales bacterium]